MTAEARVPEPDPNDPAAILRLLPERYHPQFLREYGLAIEQARQPEQYRMLQNLLRMWRLRAVAYSDPDFSLRQSSAGSASPDDVPADRIFGSWRG